MSEKPHAVAIGAFATGAIVIGITMVIFALGSGFGRDRDKVIMVFDGSVKGLSVGAPVALRGVQIGQVTEIELMMDADTVELIMLVEAELRNENIRRVGENAEDLTEELIARGLRAQLNLQSLLTGLLYIQLDLHPDQRAILTDIESPYIQIPTIPTDLELLSRKVEEMDLAKLAGELQATIEGLTTFVTSKDFQALPASIYGTLESVTALTVQLREQVAISAPKLDRALDGAADTLANADTAIPKLSALAEQNMLRLDDAIASFDQAMTDLDGLVAPDSATTYQLNSALKELALAGKAMHLLARTLEEQPESLIRGRSGDTQ